MRTTGAGQYNRRVSLQAPTMTVGSTGERTTTWTEYRAVWASILPLSGRELERAKSFGSNSQWKICLRYQLGLTAPIATTHRAVYVDGLANVTHTLLINAIVDDDMAHRTLTLFAQEVT